MSNTGYHFVYFETKEGYEFIWDNKDEHFEVLTDVDLNNASRYAIYGNKIPDLAQEMYMSMEEEAVGGRLMVGYYELPMRTYIVRMTEWEVIDWLRSRHVEDEHYLGDDLLINEAIAQKEIEQIVT